MLQTVLAGTVAFTAGGIILLALLTSARYARAWRRAPKGPGRLLPLHVWLVSLSYSGTVFIIGIGAVTGASGDLTDWRSWVRIPALLIGLAAMFVLVNFQRKKDDL